MFESILELRIVIWLPLIWIPPPSNKLIRENHKRSNEREGREGRKENRDREKQRKEKEKEKQTHKGRVAKERRIVDQKGFYLVHKNTTTKWASFVINELSWYIITIKKETRGELEEEREKKEREEKEKEKERGKEEREGIRLRWGYCPTQTKRPHWQQCFQ